MANDRNPDDVQPLKLRPFLVLLVSEQRGPPLRRASAETLVLEG